MEVANKDSAAPPSSPPVSGNNVSETTENVIQMNGNFNTGLKSNGSSGSNGIFSSSNGNISDDDDDGFLSGVEEFEVSSDRPIVSEKDEQVAVTDTLVEDDAEKVIEGVELEGGLVEESSGVGSSSVLGEDEGLEEKPEVIVASVENQETGLDESVGEVEGSTIKDVTFDYKATLPEGLEGEPKVPALVEDTEIKLNESGGEVQGSTIKDKEVVDESSGLVTEENEGEEDKVKDEETVKEVKEVAAVAEETSAPATDADQINEPVKSEVVEAYGVKVTSEGEAVVEAIDVDVVSPGVAVVEERAEKEVEDMKEEKPNVALETDAVVEAVDVDVVARGVAVIEEATEEEVAEIEEEVFAATDGETNVTTNDSKFSILEDSVNERNIGVDEPPTSEPALGDNVEKTKEVPAEVESGEKLDTGDAVDVSDIVNEPEPEETNASESKENGTADGSVEGNGSVGCESVETREIAEGDAKDEVEDEADDAEGSISDEETDGMAFGSSEAAKQFIEELERASGADNSHDNLHRIDGQIVTDSDEEVDTDDEGEGKELFDSAALAALLKAATGTDSDGSGGITISGPDGSRLFSVERPAGLGSSLRSLRPAPQPSRPNIFGNSSVSHNGDAENNLSDEEKKKLEKLQEIRVKFLRLVDKLGLSSDEPVAAQVLYRLALVAGRPSGHVFSLEAAKRTAQQLEEAEEKDDLNFSVNILVLGKCGVGKSATINSIFGEEKAPINAFQPATNTVKEIVGYVDGVKIRVFDTPGLKCSVMEQAFNRGILSSVKKFTKKNPPDIVLYVDRLDSQSRDLNDLPLLRTITSCLGNSIWRNAIVTLTHAGCAPPDGPHGTPLSYEVIVTQRSHVLQQSIGQSMGDLRMMSANLNPVSLVENHPSCRRNREGKKVLPNGQSWRPQLLLLCYSMKILSEANSTRPQDPFDPRKLFGFRARSPPLPYMLSSMLQSRPHPKLSTEQGGDNGDSDIDLDDLSDVEEDEDEYDQLPAFKPLRKAQVAKLSREQRKAYFEEYDYRVKLLQKKQWKEELRRMKEMKKIGKDATVDYGYGEDETDSGAAAPVAVPLPDMALPPSFDSDNPAFRYRFLEPTSQFLARPVLDTHGWDHDYGYDGVNVEQNLALASRFPASITVQVTKDKKDFTISLDSSISAKHGEDGSSMAGFDIQSIGKQLAYIVRGETKFKSFKKNKTAGGISVTFLGENVVPGIKLEDQITIGKQYVLVGSAGAVRSQNDTAYGANFELQRRDDDFPIGQVQSTFSMSVIKWRGDLALGFNSLAQFSVGRNSKIAVRAGINNKMSGQVSVRTSSSEHLTLALAAILPTAISVYRKLWPSVGDKYALY